MNAGAVPVRREISAPVVRVAGPSPWIRGLSPRVTRIVTLTVEKALTGMLAAMSLTYSGVASAQNPVQTVGLLLPNYDSIPVGRTAGLEGGAFVARADDTSASWYNPAGLTRAERASVSADSALYQWTTTSVDYAGNPTGTETSFDHVPAFVGLVIPIEGHEGRLVGGFSVTKRVAWDQNIDRELQATDGTRQARFGVGSQSSLAIWVPTVGLGYTPGGRWRFGASLGFPIVHYSDDETLSVRFVDSVSSASALVSSRSTGYQVGLQLSLGAQVDVTPQLSVGALVRPPGIRVFNSSTFTYDELAARPGRTVDTSFRDEGSSFQYKVPLEVDLGVAYRKGKAQVEIDVKVYSGISSYTLLGSDQAYTVVTTPAGDAPQVTTQPFVPLTTGARTIVNIALGGSYRVSGVTTLHAGLYTNRSPVSEATSPIFTDVDLIGGTIGSTFTWKHLSASIGVAYTRGTSDPITFSAPIGVSVTTPIHVSKLSMMYALSYQF